MSASDNCFDKKEIEYLAETSGVGNYKIRNLIDYGIEVLKSEYKLNLARIYLIGSVAKDYPDFNGNYNDIDLLAVTFTRKAKPVLRLFGKIDLDFGNIWLGTLICQYFGKLNNQNRYAFNEFKNKAVCLWGRC